MICYDNHEPELCPINPSRPIGGMKMEEPKKSGYYLEDDIDALAYWEDEED